MDPEAEERESVNISTGDDNSDTNALESSQAISEKHKNGSSSPSENGVDGEGAVNDHGSTGSEGKELDPAEMVIYSFFLYIIICTVIYNT